MFFETKYSPLTHFFRSATCEHISKFLSKNSANLFILFPSPNAEGSKKNNFKAIKCDADETSLSKQNTYKCLKCLWINNFYFYEQLSRYFCFRFTCKCNQLFFSGWFLITLLHAHSFIAFLIALSTSLCKSHNLIINKIKIIINWLSLILKSLVEGLKIAFSPQLK